MRVVWSTGGVEEYYSIQPKNHSGFIVGYIGTVDYAKMHPDFIDICKEVDIPDIKFIVVGGPKEKELKKKTKQLKISKKFKFTGYMTNITDYFSLFDVFGYPLASYHYGTCDQVLQMSMAAGVVPVVFSNLMEKYMVKNGITGIVAKDKDEYIKAIQKLYHNHELRKNLSKNAKKYALDTFSVKRLGLEWENFFNEALIFPKTIKKWKINKIEQGITPMDVFLESLGEYGADFIYYSNAKNDGEKRKATQKIKEIGKLINWQADTKGTVHHYNSFIPNDRYLSVWSQLMKKNMRLQVNLCCRQK